MAIFNSKLFVYQRVDHCFAFRCSFFDFSPRGGLDFLKIGSQCASVGYHHYLHGNLQYVVALVNIHSLRTGTWPSRNSGLMWIDPLKNGVFFSIVFGMFTRYTRGYMALEARSKPQSFWEKNGQKVPGPQ